MHDHCTTLSVAKALQNPPQTVCSHINSVPMTTRVVSDLFLMLLLTEASCRCRQPVAAHRLHEPVRHTCAGDQLERLVSKQQN